MELFKRNAKGKPIVWGIKTNCSIITVYYGIIGKQTHTETIYTNRLVEDEVKSLIAAKRREGYKALSDLYDNAPKYLFDKPLLDYLNTYLPKNNTDNNGAFIPMLCKTLEDNKPFFRGTYFGEYKINGERCLISATKENNLFNNISLNYRSRKGIDWTDKLKYLDEYLLPKIPKDIIDLMIEEDVALDGELYLPGYGINEINSFIKNTELPQHYQLQFWCYDLAIEGVSAIARYTMLEGNFYNDIYDFQSKDGHLNNKKRFILLPAFNNIYCINDAIKYRDKFIDLGFEGLVIREENTSYQFGGKRNNAMLKFKKILDGYFTIIDIVPEGIKRSNLPKFICKNDINDETFECTLNAPHNYQENILLNKECYIGKLMFVEYRERSGIKQVPFHAKGINIKI